MSPKTKKDETAEQALECARIARNRAQKSISDILNIARLSMSDPTKREHLFASVKRLGNLFSRFQAEQTIIINSLVIVGRSDEYESVDSPVTDTVEAVVDEIYEIVDRVSEATVAIQPMPIRQSFSALPKIELPSFDGSIVNWCAFRDSFKSFVHDDTNVDNIHKFQLLSQSLTGAALSVIKSIPLSASNYNVAWAALTDRFENKRLLATAHLDKLFTFKPMAQESVPALTAFLNIFKENVSTLKLLEVEDLADFMLFFLGSRVLDAKTRQLFEADVCQSTIPNFDTLVTFVQKRVKILENVQGVDKTETRSNKSQKSTAPKFAFTAASNAAHKTKGVSSDLSKSNKAKHCIICNRGEHFLYHCSEFKTYSVPRRREYVRTNKLCFSCLSSTHMVDTCKSKYLCGKCQQRHHTLLHFPSESEPSTTSIQERVPIDGGEGGSVNTKFSGMSASGTTVLLGTAIVRVLDARGKYHIVRVLLDSGSQISAITTDCVARIGLSQRKCGSEIVGLSQSPVKQIRGSTSCSFIPHHTSSPKFNCHELIVLPKLTSMLPSTPLPPEVRTQYQHLVLADPQFDTPSQIDMLLGGDLYPFLIRSKSIVKHTAGLPSAMDSHLGWIIMGLVNPLGRVSAPRISLLLTSNPSIDTLLHRFWSIEEPDAPAVPTTEDELCERWFTKSTSRDADGRFCVALPFRHHVFINDEGIQIAPPKSGIRSSTCQLGESRSLALKRLLNLEHRLQKDKLLYESYRSFMNDYLALGHMKVATRPGKYYIPHHAVVKRDGDTSKLRVVFDASAKSSSGVSLNDILCVGPKLQNDISELLLTCRLYKYIFIADIVKMYRQIKVRDEDCVFQHILWRHSPEQEIQEYELLTVTYGVNSAPFLAIRVLHALDACAEPLFSAAKGVLTNHTYVDDIVVGRNTEAELSQVQNHTIGLLRSAGCSLKKWCSNSSRILDCIPPEDRANCPSFEPKDEPSLKVLGLHWDPVTDTFGYHTHVEDTPNTKRGVLSAIARLFDPIGALGPMLLWAKSFMQQLWQTQLEWDTPLPLHLQTAWRHFLAELPSLGNIEIARHIDTRGFQDVQLLGFADASQKGYAATVYLRVVDRTDKVSISLVTCKTKVAPLKGSEKDESLTIPRLELCAGLLLAQILQRLYLKITSIVPISKVRAWTDSSIVLSWLTTDQKFFKIFVTNRVAKIRSLLPDCDWSHVSTMDNPADPSSRGLLPDDLVACSLHWKGPPFIHFPEASWPGPLIQTLSPQHLPEVKTTAACVLVAREAPNFDNFLLRFSSWYRLQRVLAYALRFIDRVIFKRPTDADCLTPDELQRAMRLAVRVTQRTHFQELLKQLAKPNHLVTPSTMAQLAPFLDHTGLIRVGGRLQRSMLSDDAKHPYLLPKESHVTSLLITAYHRRLLHAGPKLIIAMLRQEFWIVSCREAVRRVIFKCVTCTRHKALHPTPRMGILPEARVHSVRAFSSVGTDYGGPYLIKECKRRSTKTTKVYIALFVCMATKAIHVEMVSDLTADAFLAALDRFIARRGVPAHVYSDCGTNYVGAARQLKLLFRDKDVQTQVSARVICNWHFNPPAAPHFGGLWEAGIKSVKFHLKRVIGTQVLTYEELETLCVRVEGILNSRPLTPASTDPHDLTALTPGHFLIGQPLLAVPEENITEVPMNRLTRWQLLRQMHQSFWKRWSQEYLNTLQGRQKWTSIQDNLKVDDLVIVEAPNQPPSVWKMGRITAVHPGPDETVRVVTIKTQDGEMKRPVVKLVKLPTDK